MGNTIEARPPLVVGQPECIQRPLASASGLHTLRSLCHEPAKLLRLKSIGLHLRLCKAALNGEHILDVLGIGKLARQRQAGLGVLVGELDRPLLDDLNPDVISFDGIAAIHLPVACAMASMN